MRIDLTVEYIEHSLLKIVAPLLEVAGLIIIFLRYAGYTFEFNYRIILSKKATLFFAIFYLHNRFSLSSNTKYI
jgi:hypothetical protein